MGAWGLDPVNLLEAEILFRRATMLLNSCMPSLILVKIVMEYHAANACVTLSFVQLLVSAGVGTKWMTGAIRLDPADMVKAGMLLLQAS